MLVPPPHVPQRAAPTAASSAHAASVEKVVEEEPEPEPEMDPAEKLLKLKQVRLFVCSSMHASVYCMTISLIVSIRDC